MNEVVVDVAGEDLGGLGVGLVEPPIVLRPGESPAHGCSHGYHPFSVNVRPRSAAVIAAAVYSAVSGGRAAGSAHFLWGSQLLRLRFSLIAAPFL
jgi:hypothetical protein